MHSETDHQSEHATQAERFADALSPDSILLDERREDTLIAFAREYARLLTYYDENNEPLSNWSVFLNDISVILAEIGTFDIRRKHYEALALEWDVKQEQDPQIKNEIASHLLPESTALFDKLFAVWLEQIQRISKQQGLELELETTMGLLKDEIEPLYRNIKKNIRPESEAKDVEECIDKAIIDYRSFISYVRAFVDQAGVSLEDSLQGKSDHRPHVALYLTFVLLFKYAQASLNTLTEKHLDYYYRRILRLEPKPSVPDSVHVCFKLAGHEEEYEVKAGTLLMAGTDEEGRDLLYSTQEDLLVNQATLAAKKTLYVRKTKPVEGDEFVDQIFVFPVADSEDGLGTPLKTEGNQIIPDWALRKNPEQGWPTFGKAAYQIDPEKNQALHARIGLVLASPTFLLREGERHVQLTLAFGQDKAQNAMRAYLQRLEDACETTYGPFRKQDRERLLSETFLLYLSGEEGWIPVTDCVLTLDPDHYTMVFGLTLAPTDPAVVANQPEVLGEHFETPWPLLKILLNPEARVYPYSFIKDLRLDPERSTIRVAVKGMTTLFLQNENGPLDAGKPFQPFGSVPMQGSYLLFGNKELFHKNLDQLRLTIDWHNLPKAPAHFGTYYAAYNLGTTNDSFQATVSARSEQQWLPLAEGRSFPLFRQRAAADPTLVPQNVFTLDLSKTTLRPDYQVEEPLVFEPQTPSGFFRFELSDPPYAFGQECYPRLFADAALANAAKSFEEAAAKSKKKKKKTEEPRTLPNPPFVPVIKAFSVDYMATRPLTLAATEPDLTGDQIFYLFPFGQRARDTKDASLIPRYDGQGYLYLGLADIKPLQIVTLFFQLHVNVTQSRCANAEASEEAFWEGVSWEYLAENQWKSFPKRTVLSDTTRGFTRSGIVTLEMHSYITDNNTILPAGLHWIRAVTATHIEQRGNTLGVYTQAVLAQRVVNDAEPPPNGVLPADSITGLADQTAAIEKVFQPYPSHGYTPGEHLRLYRTRVSERLRHKQRAVHTWDYERLVLDAFPAIGQAKCITHNRNTYADTVSIRPGELVIVVVPGTLTTYEPRVDEHTLMDIATYLRRYASPHVEQICVRNPVYEYLRITATAQFARGEESGLSLERLQEAINRFVAPWQFDPSVEIQIGVGEVAERELLTYLEKLPYVESIAQFSIMHRFKDVQEEYRLTDTALSGERVVLRPSLPWAVFVPAPWHVLAILNDKRFPEEIRRSKGEELPPIEAGVGTLEVGMDFIITSKANAAPDIATPQHEVETTDLTGEPTDSYQISFQDVVMSRKRNPPKPPAR